MNEVRHSPNLEPEEQGDDEIWLISYSDLMTLLFGFFVLMFVFASTKTGDSQKVREGLARSFGGTYIPPYDQLAKDLTQQMGDKQHPIMKEIEVQTPKDGMEITFRSNLLFESGSAELKPEIKETMRLVARLIAKNIQEAEILVGGHTDDVPIRTPRFPSNWELSTARAGSVVREFIDSGFDPKMMVAMGYAETRPAYPNRDEKNAPIPENRERNRRVVVKVVIPTLNPEATGPQPIGAPAAADEATTNR